MQDSSKMSAMKVVKCPQDRFSLMNGGVVSEANIDLKNS